ncbi:MAG: hypothetical protein R3F37_04755 [Candidatus Competibacteraceae bacterium]
MIPWFCPLATVSLSLAMGLAVAGEQAPQSDWWSRIQDTASGAWEETRQLLNDDSQHDFGRVWEETLPKLEQALTLHDRHQTLPERAWFSTDQAANQTAINELLDEAITVLAISPAQRYRERIRELQNSRRQAQAEIDELRTRRVTAPQDARWQKTVADYDQAIQQQTQRIDTANRELRAIQREFAAELRRLGLVLSDEQLEFLLSTVVGDDLIDMGVAFDNVKTITEQLERLMVDSRDSLDGSRRYYGMYLVLLEILERMQAHLITTVNTRYLPEIDEIAVKTRLLMEQTRDLQQQADTAHAVLDANLEAQILTLRAADLYRDYLVEQARQVSQARERLLQDIAIARNTYETVKISGELVALMKSSQAMLDNLLQRQLPPLRAFENLAMKREFERLTAQLQAGTAS